MSKSNGVSALAQPFVFIGERLWLDFINTDDVRRGVHVDVLRDFNLLVQWLEAADWSDGRATAGGTQDTTCGNFVWTVTNGNAAKTPTTTGCW